MHGTLLSTPQKDRIVGSIIAGLSLTEASKKFERSYNSCKRALDTWERTGSTHYPTHRGRKRKHTKEQEDQLLVLANSNRQLSLQELGANAEPPISRKTVKKELKGRGYGRRKARRKPHLKDWHKQMRLAAAKKMAAMHRSWLRHIIWSDETYIQSGGSPGSVYVTRRPDEEYDEDCIMPNDEQVSLKLHAFVTSCII